MPQDNACPGCGGKLGGPGGTGYLTGGIHRCLDCDRNRNQQNGTTSAPAAFTPRQPDIANVRPITWAWQHRIPLGNFSLLVGEEGVGKGTLLAWMIARLTRGELPGDLGTPANVLIIGDEDGFDDVWTPRLLAAGADLEHVRDLPASDTLGLLDVRRDVEHLRRIVRQGGFRVVVLDALLDNLPDSTDEFKPRSVRAALRPLGRLARQERFAALGSLHTNKGGETFRQKMSGSHAFNALARSGLLLAQHPDDEDRRVLARGKGNLSRTPPSVEFAITGRAMEINGFGLDIPLADGFAESDLRIEDLLMPPGETDSLSEACEFLRDEVAEGARPTTELKKAADQAGISWRTIERAKQRLGVRARKIGASWHWEKKTAKKTATCEDGGLGGDGGVDKTAKTAKAANNTHGGVDGGLQFEDRDEDLLKRWGTAGSGVPA
jgi:putative DNA primase/helicase